MSSGEHLGALLLGAVLDAESTVLKTTAGALMDSCGVRPSDHPEGRVRTAWTIAEKLAARRRPVDANTVFATGRAAGGFQDPDLKWLQDLQASNALDGSRFSVVAEQLRRSSRGKSLADRLAEDLKALKTGADPVDVAGKLEALCRDMGVDHSRDGTGDEDVLELGAQWDARMRDESSARPLRLSTGLTALDTAIGGFMANVIVLCGQPSVGKSAVVASCIEGQLMAGIKPGLFGLEDGSMWIIERMVARRLGIPLGDVGDAKLSGDKLDRYPEVMQEVLNLVKPLVCFRHDSIRSDEMVRRAAHWVHNLNVQCLWTDHGGEVEHDTEAFEDYRLAVGDTYRRARNFSVRNKIPWVMVAHTNRESDRNENEESPPRVREIAESAYIERRARQIIGLWDRRDKPDEVRATVLKNTKGERHRTWAIKRRVTAAMVDGNSFEEIFPQSERREEAKKRRLDKAREAETLKQERERLKEAAKAARKKPEPQLGFGEVTSDDDEESDS